MRKRGTKIKVLSIRKRWLALIATLTLLLSVAPAAVADDDDAAANDGPENFYVVIMDGDPLGQANANSAATRAKMKNLDKKHDRALEAAGASTADKIQSYHFAANGFAAQLTAAEASKLASADGVTAVYKDVMRFLQTDNTPEFLGLTDPAGPWAKGLTGEDVVIGVIDQGIWPEHPSVADDGSYGPAPASFVGTGCDFGGPADPLFPPVVDDPFTCNNKLLAAKSYHATFDLFLTINGGTYDPGSYNSARDEDGHGTHTATTAAGNSGVDATLLGVDRGTLSGVAPRARVSVYKGCWNSSLGDGCFTSDLVAAIDTAVADGVDVINYSIGGGASLNGADDVAFLFAADAGVYVATSAGNSGPGAATVGGPASVPWITAVGASTQSREFIGSVDLGDGTNIEGITVTGGVGPDDLVDAEDIPLAPATSAQSELCLAGTLDPALASGKIVLCKRGVIARVAKSQNVQAAGGIGLVLYNSSPTQTLNTDNHYIPSLHISNADGLTVKAYIDSAGSPTATINGGVFTPTPGNVMAGFSSRGPNPVAADIIKPDVTAPGVNILAGNTPTALLGSPGELFQSISGTSMSSPHVAGTFALLKQANPGWSAAAAKSAIMTTARQDVVKEDGSTAADPFDFGAGHITPGGKANKGSIYEPGLVYDANLLDYAAFSCGTDQQIFTQGSCDFLAANGFSFDASDLNLPSIGIAELAGTQTVTRTVTSVAKENGNRTYNVSVDAPAGYDVTVSPSQIKLKKGQSATFEVTISNDGTGVPGVWSFGSLTWNDTTGHYDVRSPIAVKGALFDAPDKVDGSSASGSASFDVTFGYSGPYTAAAHGLESVIANSGSVWQDPDQSFSPSDTAGPMPGAVAFSFPISGAAYVRMEIPDPDGSQPEDLDLFVLNSGGTIVASSTLAGTNELVELVLPADDTYTAYVHGWAAVPDPTPFTLNTWVVSATPGGSLSVDSAPASATIGTAGTIDISWTGASGRMFGAVSHADGSGLIGLTLVEVNA